MRFFILNLKLVPEKYQEDILNKRFEIGRQIYNAILGKILKQYKEMIRTKIWQNNQQNIANIYKTNKDNKTKKELMQYHYKTNLDAHTCRRISDAVWKAISDLLFDSDAKQIHFKKYNQGLNTLSGETILNI